MRERRIYEKRDAGQEGCRMSVMQDRWDAGKDGNRTGQDRGAGLER